MRDADFKVKCKQIFLQSLTITHIAPKSVINVMIRPGAIDFIKTMSKYYEIVVFTASMQGYARPVVEKLDPEGH